MWELFLNLKSGEKKAGLSHQFHYLWVICVMFGISVTEEPGGLFWWTLALPSAKLRFSLFTLQSQQCITFSAKGRKSNQEVVEVRGALWFSHVFALNRNECNWVAQGWLGVFKNYCSIGPFRSFMYKMAIWLYFLRDVHHWSANCDYLKQN